MAHERASPVNASSRQRSCAEFIAEGDAVPVEGWDFSWFDGRATEERPRWGYARLISDRIGRVRSVLDIQTGGGEVLAAAVRSSSASRGAAQPDVRPADGGDGGVRLRLAATESWPPNVELARRVLEPLGCNVVEISDDAWLPFRDTSFDLVVSRHPTVVLWPEIARVLTAGGSYLAQHVGAGSNRELTDFMMGRQPVGRARSPQAAAAAASNAGLEVIDFREQSLRVEFLDVAAVIYFLKKVLWTVPGFNVPGYAEPLARMHEHIGVHGSFVSHSQRFLIEARKPA